MCPPYSKSASYFYPRSPCGERRFPGTPRGPGHHISIHALLAESDRFVIVGVLLYPDISIHALLAESDASKCAPISSSSVNFYPRSPCGERHVNSMFAK